MPQDLLKSSFHQKLISDFLIMTLGCAKDIDLEKGDNQTMELFTTQSRSVFMRITLQPSTI